MTKQEIIRKFDQIVEFAGVQKFLDTPVKRYSSGMSVRLAFSVTAHLEPEILLVDEVLAVGDAEFQKKCMGKMNEVTKTAGRTILFVSHNMSAIQKLCKKTILLENGEIKMFDETNKVINAYLANNFLFSNDNLTSRIDRKGEGRVKLTSFFIEDEVGKRVSHLETGKFYTFCFGYKSKSGQSIKNLGAAMTISLDDNTYITINHTDLKKQEFKIASPSGTIRCKLNQKLPFNEGLYSISVGLNIQGKQADWIKNVSIIEIREGDFFNTGVNLRGYPIYLDHDWSLE
jgi:lipopolysaccharide transport system ATP-binding protein